MTAPKTYTPKNKRHSINNYCFFRWEILKALKQLNIMIQIITLGILLQEAKQAYSLIINYGTDPGKVIAGN